MANFTTYMRIFAYIVTIVMHISNIVYMNTAMKREVVIDPELKEFGKLQPRYFTCWTFFLQIVYAIAGLICDYLLIKNSKAKGYNLPKHLRGFRDTLFSAILWPSTWVVFSVFWTLFLYDRTLIFPSFADRVVTKTSNHIMHTAIVPVVLWEVWFRPRNTPKSHKKNILHLTFHFLLYFCILTYTYIERGLWIYPIFSVLYNTIYFPLIHITIASLALGSYYMQWTLTDYAWGKAKGKIR